jgi:hypothetical protein
MEGLKARAGAGVGVEDPEAGARVPLTLHWGQTLTHLDSRCLQGMFSAGRELVDKELTMVRQRAGRIFTTQQILHVLCPSFICSLLT